MNAVASTIANQSALQRYYRFHAGIYDATRWSFLFGRDQALRLAAACSPARVLEVGCGTGRNLASLAQLLPQAELTGVDLSAAMLEQAQQQVGSANGRLRLWQRAYDQPLSRECFDVVLCSYALSMFNPGWEVALQSAYDDLKPGGRIVVVDFHDTTSNWFRQWMRLNHVCMEGQLMPRLRSLFHPELDRTHNAYGGLWRYLTLVGQKR